MEARPFIFHEDNVFLRHACDFREAEASEKAGRITLRVEKKVIISAAVLVLHKVGNDGIHEGLALMRGAHGHAAERIAEAAAGCNDMVIVVQHRRSIIEIPIAMDALLLEQCIYLCPDIMVARADRCNAVACI